MKSIDECNKNWYLHIVLLFTCLSVAYIIAINIGMTIEKNCCTFKLIQYKNK